MADFLLALFFTILIEGIILIILLSRDYDRILIARNAVIASSLTLPFVWFFFPILSPESWVLHTALAELFAFVAEAVIFLLLFTKMNWKNAVFASLLCNGSSFLFGLILL